MNKEEPIYISAYANEGYEFVSWPNGQIDSRIELIATFKEVEEENNEDIPSSTLYKLDRKDYSPLVHMSI